MRPGAAAGTTRPAERAVYQSRTGQASGQTPATGRLDRRGTGWQPTASDVLLHHCKPVGLGKFPHRSQVRPAGAVAPRKFGPGEMSAGAIAFRQPAQAILQGLRVGRTQDDRDFQPLRGIREPQGAGTGQRAALASF